MYFLLQLMLSLCPQCTCAPLLQPRLLARLTFRELVTVWMVYALVAFAKETVLLAFQYTIPFYNEGLLALLVYLAFFGRLLQKDFFQLLC